MLRVSQNPPSHPSKQLHSRASVQFPWMHPGREIQTSHMDPSQPISQVQKFGALQTPWSQSNPFWSQIGSGHGFNISLKFTSSGSFHPF